MKKYKILSVLAFLIVSVLALSGIANAAVFDITVELDDDELSATSTNEIRALDRGDEFEVKVHLKSNNGDLEDVQIEAELRGYDHNDRVEDITDVFDMTNGTTYVKKMTLKFADRLEPDQYKLRVYVSDRDSNVLMNHMNLKLKHQDIF